MHERNPYARPPDFARLAATHAELRPHCKLVANGKVHLDFADDAAVRALTRALLKEDFDLDVELPSGSLCPRVPQRLNYLLWIEDVIVASGLDGGDVRGIDIGTGASCIYALLGARRFGWSFTATETEASSAEAATRNVARNGLEGRVEVVRTEAEGALIEDLTTSSSFTFCMCNPPFFDGDDETGQRFVEKAEGRQWENAGDRLGMQKRPLPRSGTVASENELATEGGEVAFVGRLIEESRRMGERVKFYTTMLGKKSSVAVLLGRLARVAEGGERRLRFTSGELRQGRTQRWLLLWTYCEDVRLPARPASLDLVTKQRTTREAMQWIRDQLLSLRVDIVREEEGERLAEGKEEGGGLMQCRVTTPSWRRRKRKGKKKTGGGGEGREAATEPEEDPPFAPLYFSVAPRAGGGKTTPTLAPPPTVTLVFAIEDDARKRELSQLVVHLGNKLVVGRDS